MEDIMERPDTGLDPVRWLVEASARASEQLADRRAGRVLEVARVFGASVLDVTPYARGAHVRVGRERDALGCPEEVLGGDTARSLFEADGDAWVLVADTGWDVSVLRGDTSQRLADVVSTQDGALRLRMDPDTRVIVRLGLVTFVAQMVWPSKPVLPAAWNEADPTLLASVGFVGIVAVILGVIGARTDVPTDASWNTDEDRLVQLIQDLVPPPPPPAKATPAESSAASASKPRGAEGEGKRDPNRRPEVTRRANDERAVADAGLMAALNNDAALRDILGSSGLSGGILDGVTKIVGGRSTQSGPGAGWSGSNMGGGGTVGSVGDLTMGRDGRAGAASGGAWERGKGGAIGGAAGDVLVLGALDKSLIDAVVKRNLESIRYCYRRELARMPSLAGKVVIKFVIAKDGSVSTATTKTSTLNNAAAESCINGRFLRMQFPEPKGGGIVVVSYPFLFSA